MVVVLGLVVAVIVGLVAGGGEPAQRGAVLPAALSTSTGSPTTAPTVPSTTTPVATTTTRSTTTTSRPRPTTTTRPPAPPTTRRPTPPPSTAAPVRPTLTALRVAAATHQDSYDRSAFGSGWTDADGDCLNTRAEVLVRESLVAVEMNSSGCTVRSGRWIDRWSGTVTTIARDLDIDHTVPLANAWRSGAWSWSAARRTAFANDLADDGHLEAIPAGENRSKSDDGPEAWRPPVRADWCDYARTWTRIKAKWDLSATPVEWSALLEMAATC